ncbi:MAG: hypothetical protein ACO2PM_25725 [Pyrobaculum sp.]
MRDRFVGRAGSAYRLRLAYDWASTSGGGRVRLDGSPPRLCAWRLSQPPLRLVYAGREAEKPNASVATQILGRRLHQSVHKEETCGVYVGFDAGLYR